MEAGRAPFFRLPAWGAWLLLSFAAGCATKGAPLARAPGSSLGEPASSGGDTSIAPTKSEPARNANGKASTAASPTMLLPGGEEPTPEKALPELRVEPLGMHVGGGKNDAEEKAPFHRALEQKFPAFLECYRRADEPWAGGSFGIDLKIARAGGAPVAEQPRTRIRGAGFQECMVAAFGKAQFEKPKAGPTVISYSVMFTLGKPKR
jgi:hypothetical protein